MEWRTFPPFAFLHQPSFIKGLWDHSLPLLPAVVCLLPDPLFIHSCWLPLQYLCPALQACEFPVTINSFYAAVTNLFHPQDLSDISSHPCMNSIQVLGAADFFPLPLQLKHLFQVSWSVSDFPWAEGRPSGSLHGAQGICVVLLSLAAETCIGTIVLGLF